MRLGKKEVVEELNAWIDAFNRMLTSSNDAIKIMALKRLKKRMVRAFAIWGEECFLSNDSGDTDSLKEIERIGFELPDPDEEGLPEIVRIDRELQRRRASRRHRGHGECTLEINLIKRILDEAIELVYDGKKNEADQNIRFVKEYIVAAAAKEGKCITLQF